ncbi:MAG TPA: anthranilate phosphoribosyltransferase, partial [Methylophaga sp.]|nr:anthranilate phosphoribosyltransferase [Methylophaga sp.]
MDLQTAIKTVINKQDLSDDEMTAVMQKIMSGESTPAQIGGFLVGLQMKGETVIEIAAAAKVMRSLATPVHISGDHIVDTCGTGGDGASTFNVSTASAFVVAAAGAKVAKHGNRSISSSSGSADVLEAAGVNLEISPERVKHCIDTIGVGFMFAQKHHGAMKHAIGPRREMAVRTIFNLLGPLTNPAQAQHQVLGVFDKRWVEPMAHVLKELGSKHVLVVHADDGLDEISIGADSYVAELQNDTITTYVIRPEDFGLKRNDIKQLA